jgi:hypothetical protein
MKDYDLLASSDEKIQKFGDNKYATVKIKAKQYRIDKTGKIVYTFKPSDFEVERVAEYHENKFKVFEIANKVGIKQDTTIIINTKYQQIICIKRYCEPPFIAKLNDHYGIIDHNDKVLVPFKYESIINATYDSIGFLPLIKVKQKNLIFYIDLNGVEYKI